MSELMSELWRNPFGAVRAFFKGELKAPEPRTEEELEIEQLICPDCKADKEFLSGPSGGFAQNIKCAKCGLILNVIFNGPNLVWHERINHG